LLSSYIWSSTRCSLTLFFCQYTSELSFCCCYCSLFIKIHIRLINALMQQASKKKSSSTDWKISLSLRAFCYLHISIHKYDGARDQILIKKIYKRLRVLSSHKFLFILFSKFGLPKFFGNSNKFWSYLFMLPFLSLSLLDPRYILNFFSSCFSSWMHARKKIITLFLVRFSLRI
jgi:hypothetical protein